MTISDWINVIISILSGVAVCVPLVIKLVKYIRESIKAKNWTNLMALVLRLMTEAEDLYETGAERKEYVMSAIKGMEDILNYDIDENVISVMIDSICSASRIINSKVTETK
jgi:hypothetical protein